MSLTREDMLRELELLPAWQLRTPLPQIEAAPHAATDTHAETEQPVIATAVPPVQPAMRETPATPAIPVPAELPADKPMLDQSLPGEAFADEPPLDSYWMPMEETELEISPPVMEKPAADPAALRRQHIMQLDWQGLQDAVPQCTACNLADTRTQTVFGVGDPAAEWLIIGEAPGAEEDKRGEPFVGQAGKLLDNMLAAIRLKRGENVYILNVLKCRPPQNRDPHGEEVTQCDPFIRRQVELIRPKLIIALGKFAAQSILATDAPIGSLRGRLHEYQDIPVIVTYHPAYLLRNLMDKAKAWEDLCLAVKTMQDIQAAAGLQTAVSPSSGQ